MGICADSCLPGRDFQPAMSRMAAILWNWDRRLDAATDLDVPGTSDWSIAPMGGFGGFRDEDRTFP